jgi:Sec-independent protein secretion pathway component TatC
VVTGTLLINGILFAASGNLKAFLVGLPLVGLYLWWALVAPMPGSTTGLGWRFVWSVSWAFVVSALITPSVDPVTQTAIAVPLFAPAFVRCMLWGRELRMQTDEAPANNT